MSRIVFQLKRKKQRRSLPMKLRRSVAARRRPSVTPSKTRQPPLTTCPLLQLTRILRQLNRRLPLRQRLSSPQRTTLGRRRMKRLQRHRLSHRHGQLRRPSLELPPLRQGAELNRGWDGNASSTAGGKDEPTRRSVGNFTTVTASDGGTTEESLNTTSSLLNTTSGESTVSSESATDILLGLLPSSLLPRSILQSIVCHCMYLCVCLEWMSWQTKWPLK